ncbi:hypothetical protein AB4Z09_26255 [Rhodococcus sp. TAF43]|uniref:hypothetical protein n=1 Tax=Rhodococcus sp. TAF43 TaxID=3237483 RepID=UPI003F955731
MLENVTRGRVAATIAAAAAATLLVACSNDEVLLDPSARPAPTSERPAYTDQFTVGTTTFTTNLPEDARVFQHDADEARALGQPAGSATIVAWPGRDLSGLSFIDLGKLPLDEQEKFIAESVRIQLFPVDCANFEGFQRKNDTIEATSVLNGQPYSYVRFSMTDPAQKRLGGDSWKDPDLNSFYALKVGQQPCDAVMAVESYMTTSASNPLKDFGYRLFVEGEGTIS